MGLDLGFAKEIWPRNRKDCVICISLFCSIQYFLEASFSDKHGKIFTLVLQILKCRKGTPVTDDPLLYLLQRFSNMSEIRTGRQMYYNIFARFYDFFIKIHSGHHWDETRKCLVDSAQINNTNHAKILDVCCGTGSVILSFAENHTDTLTIGYDFFIGMLHKAKGCGQQDNSSPGWCFKAFIYRWLFWCCLLFSCVVWIERPSKNWCA